MNEEHDATRDAPSAAEPSPLARRLLERARRPLGVIDVERPQQRYERAHAWVRRHVALVERHLGRLQPEGEGPSATGLVLAGRLVSPAWPEAGVATTVSTAPAFLSASPADVVAPARPSGGDATRERPSPPPEASSHPSPAAAGVRAVPARSGEGTGEAAPALPRTKALPATPSAAAAGIGPRIQRRASGEADAPLLAPLRPRLGAPRSRSDAPADPAIERPQRGGFVPPAEDSASAPPPAARWLEAGLRIDPVATAPDVASEDGPAISPRASRRPMGTEIAPEAATIGRSSPMPLVPTPRPSPHSPPAPDPAARHTPVPAASPIPAAPVASATRRAPSEAIAPSSPMEAARAYAPASAGAEAPAIAQRLAAGEPVLRRGDSARPSREAPTEVRPRPELVWHRSPRPAAEAAGARAETRPSAHAPDAGPSPVAGPDALAHALGAEAPTHSSSPSRWEPPAIAAEARAAEGRGIDVARVAEEVTRIILRQVAVARERRGGSRWP